jgi:hypothetical protein
VVRFRVPSEIFVDFSHVGTLWALDTARTGRFAAKVGLVGRWRVGHVRDRHLRRCHSPHRQPLLAVLRPCPWACEGLQDIAAFLQHWNQQRTSSLLGVEVEARLRGTCAVEVVTAIRATGVDAVVDWYGDAPAKPETREGMTQTVPLSRGVLGSPLSHPPPPPPRAMAATFFRSAALAMSGAVCTAGSFSSPPTSLGPPCGAVASARYVVVAHRPMCLHAMCRFIGLLRERFPPLVQEDAGDGPRRVYQHVNAVAAVHAVSAVCALHYWWLDGSA